MAHHTENRLLMAVRGTRRIGKVGLGNKNNRYIIKMAFMRKLSLICKSLL